MTYCVKSVRIRSYSGPHFSPLGLNTERFACLSVSIYLFEVISRNGSTICEICSKLTIKTPERRQRRPSGVFIVNFEHVPHHFLVFSLQTLNKKMLARLSGAITNGFACAFVLRNSLPHARL